MPRLTAGRLCDRCHARWKYDQGYCRQCAIEIGLLKPTTTTFDREREHVERERRRRPATAPVIEPRECREATYDGIAWIVTFDGT